MEDFTGNPPCGLKINEHDVFHGKNADRSMLVGFLCVNEHGNEHGEGIDVVDVPAQGTWTGWVRRGRRHPWEPRVSAATWKEAWARLLDIPMPGGDKCVLKAGESPESPHYQHRR
jgi:hypothetical protein